MTNSGCILSSPGDWPDFSLLIAALSSATVKSPERLASALAALERDDTLHEEDYCHFIGIGEMPDDFEFGDGKGPDVELEH
ncbi:unnamed protein product [Arctogadus glacialis]